MGLVLPGEERALGVPSSSILIPKEEDGAQLFIVVSCRKKWYKVKQERFRGDIRRNFFTVKTVSSERGCSKRLHSLYPLRFSGPE